MTDIEKAIDGANHCLRFSGTCEGCPFEEESEDTATCMELLRHYTVKALKEYKDLMDGASGGAVRSKSKEDMQSEYGGYLMTERQINRCNALLEELARIMTDIRGRP